MTNTESTMSNATRSAKGSCACGAITVEAKNISQSVGACHCSTCRKISGGSPYMAVECGSDVNFSGSENISIYNSSEWAERGFCGKCGSPLFYRLKQANQYMLSSGLFNDENFNFDHQLFIEEKPAHYTFANDTKNMTGEELFAQYGAS